MIRPLFLAAAVTAVLGACTWVKMEPAGYEVRVARADEDLAQCQRRGEIAVSVRDRVGFYDRNELKVRDELEVLARNEAPRLESDTLQPLGDPVDGEQRFVAYRCHGAASAPTPPPATPTAERDAAVQTYPLRDD